MPRPIKPMALKVRDGTAHRNKFRQNPNEPKPPVGEPKQDLDHLSAEGKEVWPVLAATLTDLGVLTKVDGSSLFSMAEDFADVIRYRRIANGLSDPFYYTETEGGSVMIRPHPIHSLVDAADRRWMAWAGKFGLTPADRAKVSATVSDKPKNVFEDI
jgi:P27 family predicted phage terminase small subunit